MIKGETLKIQVTDAEATAVEFRFGGAATQTLTGVKEGDDWKASVSTASWNPGSYAWQAWATYADSSVAVIDSGSFDLADALQVGDVRSVARQNVDAIQRMLTGNAAEGVRRYKINNRELERYSVAELIQLLSYWKAELKREERLEAGRSTLGPRIAFRF